MVALVLLLAMFIGRFVSWMPVPHGLMGCRPGLVLLLVAVLRKDRNQMQEQHHLSLALLQVVWEMEACGGHNRLPSSRCTIGFQSWRT